MIQDIINIVTPIIGWEIGKFLGRRLTRVRLIHPDGCMLTTDKQHATKWLRDYPEYRRLKWYQNK